MDMYQQILCEVIAKEIIPSLQIDAAKLLELRCYQTILRIREILSDETLEDNACFQKIEEIVCALDDLGIGGGGRHDF